MRSSRRWAAVHTNVHTDWQSFVKAGEAPEGRTLGLETGIPGQTRRLDWLNNADSLGPLSPARMVCGVRTLLGKSASENMMPTNGGFYGQARTLVLTLPVLLFAFLSPVSAAQGTTAAAPGKEVKNPMAGDPAAIHQGKATFRMFCSTCHGLDASGGSRGPDLTAGPQLVHLLG